VTSSRIDVLNTAAYA